MALTSIVADCPCAIIAFPVADIVSILGHAVCGTVAVPPLLVIVKVEVWEYPFAAAGAHATWIVHVASGATFPEQLFVTVNWFALDGTFATLTVIGDCPADCIVIVPVAEFPDSTGPIVNDFVLTCSSGACGAIVNVTALRSSLPVQCLRRHDGHGCRPGIRHIGSWHLRQQNRPAEYVVSQRHSIPLHNARRREECRPNPKLHSPRAKTRPDPCFANLSAAGKCPKYTSLRSTASRHSI